MDNIPPSQNSNTSPSNNSESANQNNITSAPPPPAKKEKKRRIRKILKRYFNPKRIMSIDQIKSFGGLIRESTRGLFKVKQPARVETFDEAKQRLNLTEADIIQKTKQFLVMALIYVSLAIAAFVYAIYLLSEHSFLAAILALVLTFFLLANALREHFWYMQMKLRYLGLNLHDWIKFCIGRKVINQ